MLDEPFNSLDVDAQKTLEDQISDHREKGGIIFLTSHQKFNQEEKFKVINLESIR